MMQRKLRSAGLSAGRLQHLRDEIQRDIDSHRYQGAAVIVARNGVVGLDEAVGFIDRARTRRVRRDSVFSLLSVTKAFTNVLVLRAIELGQLSLHTKVAGIIPEFSGKPRENITVFHLLTHMSGLPPVFALAPAMPIDDLAEVVAAICRSVFSNEEPGQRVAYSPMVAHALLGEMLRRTDRAGRDFRTIVAEDLLGPLQMADTWVGVRADLRPRHVVPDFPADFPATHRARHTDGPHGALQDETAEMPWLGIVSTATDLLRFAEALRRGGELDGTRILSPPMLAMATRIHTGEHPNELYRALALRRGWESWPAYLGLGFALRGEQVCRHHFGTLNSAQAFGNHGAGSTVFWVDPTRDLTFVCLTAGIMEEGDNIERFERLSDVALSAAV